LIQEGPGNQVGSSDEWNLVSTPRELTAYPERDIDSYIAVW
jgi:hypothetical protein